MSPPMIPTNFISAFLEQVVPKYFEEKKNLVFFT